ncbi:MAG: hypothetical protein ACC707_17250 [Thiohalomonadales bacterium]
MKNLLLIMLLSGGGYFYFTYFGEKPDGLIEDLMLTSDATGSNLGIHFATPVRYLGHYPRSYGEVVQIRIRAISFAGFRKNISIFDHVIKSGSRGDSLIEDVRFEGNVPRGPFVVLKFTKPVNFKIVEGDGLRSMNINFNS